MNKIKLFVLLLTGILIIFLLIHLAGAGDVIEVLRQASPLIFGLAVGCQLVVIALWAVKWKILLRPFKPVSLTNSLKGILIGVFFNNLIPVAKAGGEPFRAYFLHEAEDVDFEDTLATIALDHILNAFPFLSVISFSLIYLVLIMETSVQMIIIIVLALLFNLFLLFIVLYFSFNVNAAKKLMFSLLRIFTKFSKTLEKYECQIEEAVEQYREAIRTLSSRKGDLATCVVISFALWLLVIVRNYVVVIALGYEVDFIVIVVVQMVGTLVGVVPILPGGLGSNEGATVFLYISFGFPLTLAVAASLLDRFISFWFMLLVGGTSVLMQREILKSSMR